MLHELGAEAGPRELLQLGSRIEQVLPIRDRAHPALAAVLSASRAEQRAVAFWAHLAAGGAYSPDLGWSDPTVGISAKVVVHALAPRRLDWSEEEIDLLWRSMALRVIERYQAPHVLTLLMLPRAASRKRRAPVSTVVAGAAEAAYRELEVCLQGFWSRAERIRVLGDLAALMPEPPPGPPIPPEW